MAEFHFSVTDGAIERIRQLLVLRTGNDWVFRISVEGGGCSGFRYDFHFENGIGSNDDWLWYSEDKKVRIVIDSQSQIFLQDAQLEFSQQLMESSFVITNPNASSSCGCGVSFSL